MTNRRPKPYPTAKDPKHNCPDCTHERCPECRDTGRVPSSKTYGGSGFVSFAMDPCPRGCFGPMLMNGWGS